MTDKKPLDRVYDERFPEFDLFIGTTMECILFMNENYSEESKDFNYIWTETCNNND